MATKSLSLSDMSMTDAHNYLRDKVGRTIRLTTQTNNQEPGTEWRINSVNKLGSTVVVSASPASGKGRGFFFPYNTFELVDAPKPAAPALQLPIKLPSRDEFALIGADVGSPLYKTFRTCAPQTPEAHDLYRTYANEYSEYDTELLDDTLRLFDILPDQQWTNETVMSLFKLLRGAAEVETAPEPFVPAPVIIEESHVPDVVEVPEVTIEQEVAAAPRKRGRPPGSKNKPKTLDEQVQADEQQYTETARRARPEPQWQDEVKPGTISNGFATMTVGEFQKKFSVIDVPDVNLQADENFETVYTDLKDKHFQKELHILVGQMLEYLNNTATDPQALLREAVKVVSNLV